MRWFFVLVIMLNGVFYLTNKSEQGFDVLSERLEPVVSSGEIQLLVERDGEKEFAKAVPELEEAQLELPVVDVCLFLGPYSNESDIARDRARQSDLVAYVEEFERGADYWVYLGPYASLGGATKMSGELRNKRIDNFVIRKGELKDAISLGVFTDAERAATHAAGLGKKGYEVKIRRIAKLSAQYWLVFSGRPDGEAYSRSEKIMAELEDNDKSLGKKSCNLIASYKQLD
ncbi:SPOR domain-containing protein [Zhongshania sp.]|uniref:SPOR domain-containing protein n=1 Tax=Zhongshania sp. TaxID=1971902 RepID=UPI00356A9393